MPQGGSHHTNAGCAAMHNMLMRVLQLISPVCCVSISLQHADSAKQGRPQQAIQEAASLIKLQMVTPTCASCACVSFLAVLA